MTTAGPGILDVAQALRHKLVPGDLERTLTAITMAAVEVLPGVHHASIGMRHADGTLSSYAVTGAVVAQLDERQFELREGPCYDGAVRQPFVASSDLLHDPRYPRYGPFAASVGVRSSAGIRLFENLRAVGALNLFSRDVGAFDSTGTLNQLFSHQAAVALAYSMEVEGLTEALQTRSRIGQAVGIVMERYLLPEQEAFALLTQLSQQGSTKLRHIADDVVAEALRH